MLVAHNNINIRLRLATVPMMMMMMIRNALGEYWNLLLCCLILRVFVSSLDFRLTKKMSEIFRNASTLTMRSLHHPDHQSASCVW